MSASTTPPKEKPVMVHRPFSVDPRRVLELIPPQARVLDLGCGGGELLRSLRDKKGCAGLGIDHDPRAILACIQSGIEVIDADIDAALDTLPSHHFDYVILNHTLQALRNPVHVLKQMLRIGTQAIVTYPNFAYLPNRMDLMFRGRMPENKILPYSWFDTPNIHFCTRTDFIRLCTGNGWRIRKELCLDPHENPVHFAKNLFSSQICAVLEDGSYSSANHFD